MSNIEQKYSIKDLEKISGIKAHTIRIWEQRYNMFNPERTDTNIRVYTDEHLKKLLNVGVLLKSGLRVSEISKLSDDELHSYIQKYGKTDNQVIAGLVNAMIDFDSTAFNNIVNNSIMYAGFEQTLDKFIYPLFEKIGLLWQTNSINPAHEHFVSNILRQKMFSEIEKLSAPAVNARKIILFLHENEQHELGLLYAYYILKKLGLNVVYLGQNLPIKDLLVSWSKIMPKYILTFFVSHIFENEVNEILIEVSNHTVDTKILVSGVNAKHLANTSLEKVLFIDSPKKLKNIDFIN